METILVGIIVALALAFCVRSFIRIYRGEASCGCGSSCECSPDKKECCGHHSPFVEKQP